MCRCSRDGAVTQVSHALASLLGYDTPDEVQKVDFAATVFESGDELQWIVDRCLGRARIGRTTWRRKDGSRVIVRVLAVATTADSVNLAAQDITAFPRARGEAAQLAAHGSGCAVRVRGRGELRQPAQPRQTRGTAVARPD